MGWERNVLICDMGGDTFNVSLLIIDDGIFEVSIDTESPAFSPLAPRYAATRGLPRER